MRLVYKYVLDMGLTTLALPAEYKFLYAGFQDHRFCIWCEVEPESAKIDVRFKVYPTGMPIDEGMYHLRTFHVGDGMQYLWHLYHDNAETYWEKRKSEFRAENPGRTDSTVPSTP